MKGRPDRAVLLQKRVSRGKKNQENYLCINLAKVCFRALFILPLYS